MDAIERKVLDMNNKVKANTSDIATLRQVVLGNGDVGMDEEIRNMSGALDRHIKSREKQENRRQNRQDKLWVGTIIALITNGIIFIGVVITMFLRFWPIWIEMEKVTKVVP